MRNRSEIHERVLNAKTTEELMGVYGEWAARYDRDLLGEMGYVAPMLTCKMLQEHLPAAGARVLDAGCGTGIVGECLNRDGFSDICGLDYSKDMLEQAGCKNVYGSLSRADLTRPLEFADNTFDAVISVSTFTRGHVGPVAFDELARVTKPGGFICFTVRDEAWEPDGFAAKTAELEQRGAWKLVERKTADYIKQEGAQCEICLYQVTG